MSTNPRARIGPLVGLSLLATALLPGLVAAFMMAPAPDCRAYPVDPVTPPQPKKSWDYGDAPDSVEEQGGLQGVYVTFYNAPGALDGFFPTLANTVNAVNLGQPGARHNVVTHGWLGSVDGYVNAGDINNLNLAGDPFPSVEGDADDLLDPDLIPNLDPSTLTADHDLYDNGLLAATLKPGAAAKLTVRASSTWGFDPWYLNVLADWNYDGRWGGADPANGAPEWAVQNQAVSVPAMKTKLIQTSTFTVGTTVGTPWVRVTLTSAKIDAAAFPPTGWDGSVPPGTFDLVGARAFACGETEDYCGRVSIAEKVQDQGREQDGILCTKPDDEGANGGGEGCVFGRNGFAEFQDIKAGAVSGQAGYTQWTGQTGLGFPATVVSTSNGLDVTVRYSCVKWFEVEWNKVHAPPFTMATGFGPKGTYTPGCGVAGTQTHHFSGLDAGEYDFILSYNPCTGFGQSLVEHVIIYGAGAPSATPDNTVLPG